VRSRGQSEGRFVSDRSHMPRASCAIDGSASIAAVSAARTSMGNLISLTTLRIVVFCDTSHASLGAWWVRGKWLREAASISRRESTGRVSAMPAFGPTASFHDEVAEPTWRFASHHRRTTPAMTHPRPAACALDIPRNERGLMRINSTRKRARPVNIK
jgi:hypothetical protein